ncbi:MAG: hypothetical protein AAFU71_15445 [Cyanobacteria bacterium J06632_22]
MLEIIAVLPTQQQAKLRQYLNQHRSYLTADISRYAVGRQRFWLEHQAVLGSYGKQYQPGRKLPRLWAFCQTTYQQALLQAQLPTRDVHLGLIAYGEVGIKKHRDDTYAAIPAVSINLSSQPTLWGYTPAYTGFEARQPKFAEEVVHTLPPGAVVLFNSKNLHRVVQADADRWSINLWSIAPRCFPYFETYLKETAEKPSLPNAATTAL